MVRWSLWQRIFKILNRSGMRLPRSSDCREAATAAEAAAAAAAAAKNHSTFTFQIHKSSIRFNAEIKIITTHLLPEEGGPQSKCGASVPTATGSRGTCAPAAGQQ